jgi:hypothetical protein
MRLTRLFKAALVIASLALALPALTTTLVSPARAAVEVEIGNDQFYDELSPYGDWVWYKGGYVFVPGDVDDRWRPYAVGRWVYTDEYGWMWVSDEPFGWATYHYGRWGYGDDLGWYWVPGRVWAPAWVSWRRGPDYVVWAPLPPTYGDDYYDGDNDEDYEVADNDIPDNYWNAVPAVSFLAANLAALIYADDDEDYGYHRRRYIDETEYLGPVRYRNRMVLNNGLDANFIEKETNQKVRRYKVRETDDWRGAGKRNGDEIQIYDRKVKYRPDAKPRSVKNAGEVEQKHGKRLKRGDGDNQEVGSKKKGSNQPQFGGQEQPENLKKRKQQSTDGIDNTDRKKNAKQIDDQSTDGQKLTKKQRREAERQKKKQRNQDVSNENENSGQAGKRKKRNQGTSNQEQLGVMDNSQGGESSGQGKKKKRNQGTSNDNSQGSDGLSNQQGKKKKRSQGSDEFAGGKQKKNRNLGNADQGDGGGSKKRRNDAGGQDGQSGNGKKRKKGGCDPNSGENC